MAVNQYVGVGNVNTFRAKQSHLRYGRVLYHTSGSFAQTAQYNYG